MIEAQRSHYGESIVTVKIGDFLFVLSYTMSSSSLFGILAALVAPLVMTIGFFVWDNNWAGSTFSLNLFKCNLASVGFLIVSISTRADNPFPPDIFTGQAVGFLMLSSVIGIVIGDYLWLEGLRLLGARRVIVVDSCKPFFAALLGWPILGEQLKWTAFVGMIITIIGVVIVSWEGANKKEEQEETETAIKNDDPTKEFSSVVELANASRQIDPSLLENNSNRNSDVNLKSCNVSSDDDNDNAKKQQQIEASGELDKSGSLRDNRKDTIRSLRKGFTMSLLNVILDTYGSVLTKQYGSKMSTWEISLIRFGFAGVVMLIISVVMMIKDRCVMHRYRMRKRSAVDDRTSTATSSSDCWYTLPKNMTRSAWIKVIMGVSLVTFLTPALTNYALFQIALALALTLSSVGPLYALPLSWLLQKEMPTLKACIGATLAVVGVVVLSLFGRLE